MATPKDSRGETLPAQGEQQEGVPRAPHERDESATSQAESEPSTRGKLGKADVERGVVDTTKGAELGRAYDRQRDGPKK